MRTVLSILITGLILCNAPTQAQSNTDDGSTPQGTTMNEMKHKLDECKSQHHIMNELELPAYKTCLHACAAPDDYFIRFRNGTPPSQEEIQRAVDGCNTSHKEVMAVAAKNQKVSPSVRLGLTDLTHQGKIDQLHRKCINSNAPKEHCDCATTKIVKKLNVSYTDMYRGYPRAVMACEKGR